MAITNMQDAADNIRPPSFFTKNVNGSATTLLRSLWPATGGVPAAGVYNATRDGVVLSSSSAQITGQIYFSDPASGNAYLAKLSATPKFSNSSESFGLLLCDRLWHNGGYTITSTAAQNSTTPAWPARDANGTANGDGVVLGLEISADVGAGTPTVTIDYTNSAGTAGRSGTNINATAASAPFGVFYPIGLQAGDIGVRSVQSLTLSATWTSGTINLVAYRPLALLTFSGQGRNASIDALTGGFPKLYNGSVPFFLCMGQGSANPFYTGSVSWAHG